MIGLDQTATVYVRGPDGAHSVVAASGVPVRLCTVSSEGPGLERVEAAGTRRLLYNPDVALPEGCELEVEAERWAAVRGTQARLRGPSGTTVYQRCDVVRADGG